MLLLLTGGIQQDVLPSYWFDTMVSSDTISSLPVLHGKYSQGLNEQSVVKQVQLLDLISPPILIVDGINNSH